MNYRIGFPGWKIAAKSGARMYFRVRVCKDSDSNTYWASSDDLAGLAVAGDTLDDVERAIEEVAPILYRSLLDNGAGGRGARAKMSYSVSLPCAA
jgi:predicted RNase H-like HicB family nuclease